jgi:hypothetical protein
MEFQWGSVMRSQSVLRICLLTAVSVAIFSSNAHAQQKTAKACDEEWKANKTTIQASGKKKKEFIAECRAGTPTTTDRPATTTAPAPTQKAAPAPAPTRTGQASKAGQYGTEAAAKSHCPADTVVWANTNSNVYHYAGTHNYGTTKSGTYMCEGETAAAGVRAAKNEHHP